MATSGVVSAGKIEELESLRGLAALLVVFFHMPKWHPWLDIGLINNGYLMVELFFVLSGYVICNAYGDRIASRRALLRFQWLRFGRLYPVHLLFLFGFLAIEITKLVTGLGNSPAFSENSPEALVQQLFLLQAIGDTGNAYTFNAPAWSISTEFYTYLIFALVVLYSQKWRNYVFSVIAFGSFAALLIMEKSEANLLLNCLSGFFSGCLTFHILKLRQFTWPSFSLPFAMFIFIIYISVKTPERHDWLIFPLSAFLIVALLRARDSAFGAVMRSRVLIWLGALSYSIYMSHSLIISLIMMMMKRELRLPQVVAADGATVHILPPWGSALAVSVSVFLVLGVSQLVFRFVEVPLREKSRRIAAERL